MTNSVEAIAYGRAEDSATEALLGPVKHYEIKPAAVRAFEFGELVRELRDSHIQNNWPMRQQAADAIERLTAERDANQALYRHAVRKHMECCDLARLDEALAAERERCAKIAEAKAIEFLSPEYAAEQPFGSICERFACEEVAKAIRSDVG